MNRPRRSYPLKFSILGGGGFGLYFTLGLAYFETFASGSWLAYILAGICLVLICGWLSARHFSRNRAQALMDGLKTGLLGLVVSGIVLWGIGGLLTEDGFSWGLLYRVFFNLMLVGILPVVAILISFSPDSKVKEVAVPAGNTPGSQEVQFGSAPSEIVFDAGSGEARLCVAAGDLILIEAADNYCKIHFLQGGGRSSKLVRMPMKDAERAVQQAPGFFRCHRSFIVNGRMVEKVLGASQSYRLKLRHFPDEVPVSRSFDIAVFRDSIR